MDRSDHKGREASDLQPAACLLALEEMERLPAELLLRIFHPLDHRSLAAAHRVCRKWKAVASDDELWSNLFKERWGGDRATSYAPNDPKSWKDVYIVQDRCDRFGVGTKIIREGSDYYLIHHGEIRRFLGTSQPIAGIEGSVARRDEEERASAISDRILFFLGDLETSCTAAKRVRM